MDLIPHGRHRAHAPHTRHATHGGFGARRKGDGTELLASRPRDRGEEASRPRRTVKNKKNCRTSRAEPCHSALTWCALSVHDTRIIVSERGSLRGRSRDRETRDAERRGASSRSISRTRAAGSSRRCCGTRRSWPAATRHVVTCACPCACTATGSTTLRVGHT